jgi:hypothetical protein
MKEVLQGNQIELVAGLPTVYNKTWTDNGERPEGEWTYSWYAWNSTDRYIKLNCNCLTST